MVHAARSLPTRPSGPEPTIDRFAGPEVEVNALVARIRGLLGQAVPAPEIAVLVRINAQLPPIEEALTRAGIPYSRARTALLPAAGSARCAPADRTRALGGDGGGAGRGDPRALFAERLGYDAASEATGDEAEERAASLELLLTIAADLVGDPVRAGSRRPPGRARPTRRRGGGG